MIKKDFITSIVLIAFSISVIVMSYTMPRLERRGIDPFSAPGVVPGMIGGILLCLALILFVRSVRRGGYLLLSKNNYPEDEPRNRGAVLRVSLTLIISVIYAIGFLGRVNYSVATAVYIFGFICLFEYQSGVPLTAQKRMFFHAVVQALIGAVAITLVFQKLFLVDLP